MVYVLGYYEDYIILCTLSIMISYKGNYDQVNGVAETYSVL